MENTILARDINSVINGYKERNIYIKRFLSEKLEGKKWKNSNFGKKFLM